MLVIVIVSYKNNQRTIQYVREELSKIVLPHRIVIVNNGSTIEESRELSNELGAELLSVQDVPSVANRIFVISNPQNSGFAIGNNIGARMAMDYLDADYILFSNNDLRFLDTDVVERLQQTLKEHPEIGIIGPRIVGLDGKAQSPELYQTFANRYIWMYLLTPFITLKQKKRIFRLDYSEQAQEGIHYKLMGAFFMVRAEDFASCGMMDEHTFLYAEEPILTERMAKIGKKPYYYPQVSICHEHGQTIGKSFNTRKADALLFDSEVYYYQTYKNVGNLQVLIARIIRNILYILHRR